MKGVLIQTTLHGRESLNRIVETGMIGKNLKPLGSQPPIFKDRSLVFCSYICEGYKEIYGDREGIIFETDSLVVYACPVDTFELMRGGNWLPGYERFIFSSIEDMVRKYPTSTDFKRDFQEYFRRLKPREVYSENTRDFAESHHATDCCLNPQWAVGCNEIAFPKPLKIKNPKIFSSREELENFLI